jgi:hypothetical protein
VLSVWCLTEAAGSEGFGRAEHGAVIWARCRIAAGPSYDVRPTRGENSTS